MEDISKYYKERQEASLKHMKSINRSSNVLVFLRVLIFVGGVTGVIFAWSIAWLSILLSISTIVLFAVLVKRHIRIRDERDYWKELEVFYRNELKGIDGDWSFASGGEEYHTPDHDFAHDIDLFGERSFFQRVNRTSLKGGEEFLAKQFLSNNCENVEALQEVNKELANNHNFIEHFVGYARIQKSEVSPSIVKDWISNFRPFLPLWVKYLGIVFTIISVGVIGAFGAGMISGYLLSAWLVIGLMLVGIWLKPITKFNGEVNKIVASIKSYGKLLHIIEEEEFKSEILKGLKRKVENEQTNASKVIHELSRGIDLFNNRNNLIVALLGNGFFLWDLQTTFRLQKWLSNHAKDVLHWLDVLYEFDGFISLAIYANNHTHFNYPIVDQSVNIRGKRLGHPLIQESQCVTNDVNISPANFLIITGANMAGKSTFLRTISLAILMTNLGLPVYAEELKIKPQKLITSMRSSDSLLEDESYFFAELKRLKYIIDKIESEDYFVVLDEILKGTNSKDKEEGSKKFVRRLVGMKATGIIATHDLGLCEIDKEHPEIHNYYFDAEIVNDELHFDYKMKEGVCKNMNASFLLRKMKIVSD